MTTTIINNNSNGDDNNKLVVLRIAVGSTNPCKINAVRNAIQIVLDRHHQNLKGEGGKKDDHNGEREDNNNNNNNGSNNNNNEGDDDYGHGNNDGIAYELDIKGYSSPSGVSDQPFGDEETKLGAKNRALHAFETYGKENHGINPHFAIGLEGGLEWSTTTTTTTNNEGGDEEEETKTLWCMAWMAIYGSKKQSSSVIANLISSKDCIHQQNNHNHNNNDDHNNIPNQQPKFEFGLSKTGMFQLPTSIARLISKGIELGIADDQIFGRINSKHGSGTVGLLTDGLIDRSMYYEHALILALIPWIRPDVY